jgi:hypothetical protein
VGEEFYPKWWISILLILTQYSLHMKTVNSGGRHGLYLEGNINIEQVSEINQWEGVFTPNGQYCPYSFNIACRCK